MPNLLCKYQPSNYRMIIALLMHMLRNIPYSPITQTTYFRSALKELWYEKIIYRFRTFFLHDLDLEHAIFNQIVEEDSNKCLLAMSWLISLKKIKGKLLADQAMVVDEEPIKQFLIHNASS